MSGHLQISLAVLELLLSCRFSTRHARRKTIKVIMTSLSPRVPASGGETSDRDKLLLKAGRGRKGRQRRMVSKIETNVRKLQGGVDQTTAVSSRAVMLGGKSGFIYDYCRKIISIDGNVGERGGPLQPGDGWA